MDKCCGFRSGGVVFGEVVIESFCCTDVLLSGEVDLVVEVFLEDL